MDKGIRAEGRLLAGFLALAIACAAVLAACGTGGSDGDGANGNAGFRQTEKTERDTGPSGSGGGAQAKWQALAGGPEQASRPQLQLNNHILQQKFPSVLVLRGPENARRAALTFDDGPDRRFTPAVLDVLKKHRTRATFFLIGARVKALPEVARRIAEEGHVVGNHSYWHPKLWEESEERIRWEVTETDRVIREVAGYAPKLFRPPYGGMNDDIVQLLGDLGCSIVGWSVDSLDWKQIPADEVESNVLGNVHPGAIILFHSAGDWSQDLSGMVEALDRIIPKLKGQGIELVTIPELIGVPAAK